MMFITVFLGILDLNTGEVVIGNARHLPPILLDGNGCCQWLEVPPGKPLGITDKALFTTCCYLLKPGDCLLVLTDGVTEAQNQDSDFYGSDRPLESLQYSKAFEDADRVIARLLQDVRNFAGEAPQSDDIAMLCICYQ